MIEAWTTIVTQLVADIKLINPSATVHVGQPQKEIALPFAVITTIAINRERIGPRMVQENYEFQIGARYAKTSEGSNSERAAITSAKALGDKLTPPSLSAVSRYAGVGMSALVTSIELVPSTPDEAYYKIELTFETFVVINE